MMIRTHSELISVFLDAVHTYDEGRENGTKDAAADAKNPKTTLGYIVRLNDRYLAAQAAAPRFGLIGVGCITFAQNRMIRFQERIARQIARKET